ncbi:MAG: hypothetical protein Q9201_007261 [Fulgogasparrea decipioides]
MESHDDISESPQPQQLEQQASTSSALSPIDTLGPSSRVDSFSLTHAFDRLQVRDEHLTLVSNPPGVPEDQNQSHEKLPMAERMFPSLEVIFQHAIDESKLDIDVEDCRSKLRRAEEDSKQGARSILDLQWIRSILDQLSQTRSEHITQAATVLADGARDDSWRLPFGQSGLLGFFLGLASAQATGDLLVASLRFIGNACADTDVNRERAISPDCPVNSVETIAELLHEEGEATDMLQILNTIGIFLQHDQFQRHFIDRNLVNTLLDLLQSDLPQPGSKDSFEELSLLRNATNQILADISATAMFANKYTVQSPLVNTLVQWLSTTPSEEHLQICSCLTLGNLARSDQVCRAMIGLHLHEKLLEILKDSTCNMQIAYAALGFLRNLALPTENKTIIGSQGAVVPIISSFWSVDVSPQVQHTSVSLLRQLLNGCIGNVRWLLDSLSPDEDSPAYEKTYLSLLLLLFGRTDDVATRIEIGRTVATISRCLHSSSQGLPPQSTSAIMHRLYAMHTEIARPLAMMISQSRFPVVRSEGWFALALMARSQEGSAAVSEVLQQLEVFGILVSTITGQLDSNTSAQSVPAGPSGGSSTDAQSIQQLELMRAKDRENALVLVNELLKNSVRLDFLFVSIFHNILL